MEITSINKGDTPVIQLRGRFDFSDFREFKETYESILKKSSAVEIELDLSGVEYLDSSALGMLFLMRERAHSAGKKVVLSGPNSAVRGILEIANFNKLFTIS